VQQCQLPDQADTQSRATTVTKVVTEPDGGEMSETPKRGQDGGSLINDRPCRVDPFPNAAQNLGVVLVEGFKVAQDIA
jgi:hypothetical protein